MQDLLQRLEQWLQEYRPNYASQLRLGLSMEEIVEITEPLPFQLPNEVIELYQWHNGTLGFYDDFFLAYRFLPLREAVEETLQRRKDANEYPLNGGLVVRNIEFPRHLDWQYNWFCIFYKVKYRIAIVASDYPFLSTPIICMHGEDSWTKLWFKSLKGFISAVLECYETELYLLEDFGLDDAEEIWAKYRDLE